METTPPTIDLRASLEGRTALVTGGSRGIGKECVLSLLAHGANVAFTYNRGKETAEELVRQFPDKLSCHQLDLQNAESILRCIEEVRKRWGNLHILVNNAAVGSATVAKYEADPARQDSAMFQINADGALKVCQAGIETMKGNTDDRQCKLINISSVGGGIQVFPHFRLADGMSKAAIAFLTKQLAAELVQTRIDVFAVCPGATDTEMFQESTLNSMTPGQREAFEKTLPKGRLIDPAEIARLVTFLASEHSTVLHGSVLDASMGLGVRPGLITEAVH